MSPPSRRELFRIVYPLAERPVLEHGRLVHDVVDCSELGLRYEVRDRRLPAIDTQIGGIVRFRRGDWIEVTGKVIRSSSGIVVLALDRPGVTFAEVLAEQRYLRSKGYRLRE